MNMTSVIKSMAIVQYYRDDRPWDIELVKDPTWKDVESAIRQMDNYCFPIVLLSRLEFDSGGDVFEDEDAFNIIGAADKCALLHMTGEWRYEDPDGSTSDVRLWESDQGYFCQERNVIRDIEKVLRIVKVYYDSGSYEDLDAIK
jgi:hypothetical protein